jgi:PKD repeat protein
MKRYILILLALIALTCMTAPAGAAYDPTWSRTACSTYSYNGLNERYVYAANLGWINNNKWDGTDVEGVDCSAYVSRCLALPGYVAENQKAGYPYSTYELFNGVDHMVRIYSIYDLEPWDLWVWQAAYGGPSPGHAGLFKQFNGSYIVTREAVNPTSGIVERNRRIQDMIDWGCRYYRRENWAGGVVVDSPTVETNAASTILDTSASLSGLITDDGGAAISTRGFAWGTTSACDAGWVTASTSSNGSFGAVLNGLTAGRRYYFQARAQNSAGWGSGLVRNFTTLAAPVGPQIIIDNGQSGTLSTGTWTVSSGTSAYGSNSLWARDGATYTWRFNSQPAGIYEVSMWWTQFDSRGTAIPVAINHADGTAQTTVNQQLNGGRWNVLGQYYFNGSGSVTLTANRSYPTSHCADAVKFVMLESKEPPVAEIDFISPESGETDQLFTFSGHGTADGGSITAYEWVSSIDGLLSRNASFETRSLSAGTHVISFRVCDSDDVWSETDQASIRVIAPVADEVIIDNGNSGTSYTGNWQVSGAEGSWGANSIWSRDGSTYRWSSNALSPGLYEVFMWWTEYPSRSTSAPVSIQHADGQTQRYVNQRLNGSRWNSLGVFTFGQSASVTLSAPLAYPTSYCADAVRFVRLTSDEVIADFTAAPLSGDAPLRVAFTDQSSAPGIVSWRWDFDNNGTVDSTQQNPSYTYTTPGTYSVRLTVYSDSTSSEMIVTDYIQVHSQAAADTDRIIVDNGSAATSSWGTWGVSGGTNAFGANSLWARETAGYRWNLSPQSSGTYRVSLWWTEYYSRGTRIPVTVTHSGGTANLTVNQQTNGGQWNAVGTFSMTAGQDYYVQVNTADDGSTACADAVQIERIAD